MATAAALLLLFGAMGKSAQVPLHVWLPDAMAGPTPASALIHAATMVAAGVFLVFRTFPIFEASGDGDHGDALHRRDHSAASAGCSQRSSTTSRRCSRTRRSRSSATCSSRSARPDTTAALYHLTTHAFFKSLLFLGAGVIIHATHTQDMREMGGLRKFLPWTTATFTIGSLALAGVFPFSGFWSQGRDPHRALARGALLRVGGRALRRVHHRFLRRALVVPRVHRTRTDRAST